MQSVSFANESAQPLSSDSSIPSSRNPQKIYFLRFAAIFAFVFCVTLVLCIFFVISPDDKTSAIISSYMRNPFAPCVYFADYVSVIFGAAASDMLQLLAVLILGFTLFSALSCSAIVIYRGFSLGICVSYLSSFLLTQNAGAGKIAMAWIFAASYILSTLCVCMFAAASCSLSRKIKANMPLKNGKSTIKKTAKSAAAHTVKFLTLGGQIILIKAAQLVLYALIAG
jgi:hypothetical protein